jgi:hypothetical protein
MKQQTNSTMYLSALQCVFTRVAQERGFPFGLGYVMELDYVLMAAFNHVISLYRNEMD